MNWIAYGLACAAVVTGTTDEPTIREQIASEARAAAALAETDLGRRWLSVADDLAPMPGPRTMWYRRTDRSALTAKAYAALSASEREGYEETAVSEQTYYGRYSTPIAYLRALDIAAAAGLKDVDGVRIADFGFGNVGQLRMLSSLGAHTIGIEIEGTPSAVYSQASDTGPVARAPEAGDGAPGSIELVFGQYPTTPEIIDAVGDDLALFMSKNTLKKGYIHPEREVNPAMLVHLGVDDETYVRTVYEALRPGGLFVIYNLYPQPGGPDEPYKPWASGACPFAKDLVRSVGFEVVAWNVDDSAKAQAMGRALGWNDGMSDEEYATNFNGMFTVLRKPGSSP